MEIYETNDSFEFDKLVLTKPTLISGGNYFIRCLVNNNPLYIQPPKCKTKQGIIKAGKRFHVDLMFTNENESFIRWMENLENYCQQFIYKNKDKWFDGDMELHDIENYFTSPIKLYKSGKYYITRVNLNVALNKPMFKIYDENENEVNMEKIIDNTNVITIVEIQGIKCSSRSFQIEIDLKQMLILQPTDIFEKCIIKPTTIHKIQTDKPSIPVDLTEESTEPAEILQESLEESSKINLVEMNSTHEEVRVNEEEIMVDPNTLENNTIEQPESIESPAIIDNTVNNELMKDIEEIELHLEELGESETIQLKKRDDVYYEMYREARKKAKIARDLALSSYLEAKRIKNTYMLTDIDDSDDSDLENDFEEDEDSENEDNI
jgi:hypothetical protein